MTKGSLAFKAAPSGRQRNRRRALFFIGCERLTVQSGGTMNGLFLREKLFDFVDVVVAPALIGGKDTATLIDGRSLRSKDELSGLGVLRLIEAVPLRGSYVRLRYQVIG